MIQISNELSSFLSSVANNLDDIVEIKDKKIYVMTIQNNQEQSSFKNENIQQR